MEHRNGSNVQIAPALPRSLGYVMLGVTLASIVLLLFGLLMHVV